MTTVPSLSTADSYAEEAVLGACLHDHHALFEVVEILSVDHFYKEEHRIVYRGMLDLVESDSPVDLITITSRLEETSNLKRAGGATYVSSLSDTTPDVANAGHYAQIVKRHAIRRRLADLGSHLLHSNDGVEDLLDTATSRILQISVGPQQSRCEAIGRSVGEAADDSLLLSKGLREQVALSTGIGPIDDKLLLRPGRVVVLAGSTSCGKTSLAVQIARHIAQADHQTIVFSLEMSRRELADRLLASETGIPVNRIATGALAEPERATVAVAPGQFRDLPLFVDDSAHLRVVDIRARARRRQLQLGLHLVVIDYLQLITPSSKGRSREQEVGEISRGIKLLARALAVPVILVSQLSRRHLEEKRAPQLRDLRESGAIENDADAVVMLYRPNIQSSETELLIRKQRQGPLGRVRLLFDGPRTRFEPVGGSL